jgi:hypothetical protein
VGSISLPLLNVFWVSKIENDFCVQREERDVRNTRIPPKAKLDISQGEYSIIYGKIQHEGEGEEEEGERFGIVK